MTQLEYVEVYYCDTFIIIMENYDYNGETKMIGSRWDSKTV